jgi:hypothetical protein
MQHRTRRRVLAAAALATTATTVMAVTSASAAPPRGAAAPAAAASVGGKATSTHMAAAYGGYPLHIKTLTTDVVGPLQIAVGPYNSVYVADDFAGVVKRIGAKNPVFTPPIKGYEVGGVDVDKHGTVAVTWGNVEKHKSYLTVLRHGKKVFTADLGYVERKYNPDKRVSYGAQTDNAKCLTQLAAATGGPAKYKGLVDTHAYSVKAVRDGWVVGDAGGNDLLFVNRWGKVRVLKVLPAQPYKITAAAAEAFKAPDCVGVTYNFEAVPTDVEQGRDGRLYVTTLPGGPEGSSPLGPRGSVWRLDRKGHHLTRLATGFSGATNLAITTSGRVLVAELFAGRISTIEHGRPAPVIDLPQVASVEFANHSIYAGVSAPFGENGPTGKGKVVRISVRW